MRSRSLLFALAFASSVAVPSGVFAQPRERRNTVSASPLLGILGLARFNVGAWAINYERRVGDHLGVLVEASGVHVHGPPMHMWLFGGTVGARWHFLGLGSSPFVGLQAGYRYGFGRSAMSRVENGVERIYADPSLTAGQILVVANVGYRWVHASGFTVTGRLGAGYGPIETKGSENTPESAQIAQTTNDVLGYTSLAVDTELSVGYSF